MAAQEHFGMPVSRNGIWNLLAAPRQNSVGASRGLVMARPAKVISGEKKQHPRFRWSASIFKYDKQMLALASSQGILCVQVHGDDMAKVPMYIPCRPGSSAKGFVMTRHDGKPAFTELDHSFPVADRMLMAISGWVFCAMPSAKEELDRSKPTLKMAAPSSVHAFIRAVRYAPVSCRTHAKDLMDAFQAEPGVSGAEILLLGVDNGSDYSVQNPVFQHILYRQWRKQKAALVICDAQAPYHSSWHWEIESQWRFPRNLIAGQAFGRGHVDGDPMEQDKPREECLRDVSTKAVKEYVSVLRQHAKCGDKPWRVETRTSEQGEMREDFDLLHHFYTCSSVDALGDEYNLIKQEANDLQMHVIKVPSSFRLTMCTTNQCTHCRKAEQIRQAEVPGWSASKVLAPLAANGYKPWFPCSGGPSQVEG